MKLIIIVNHDTDTFETCLPSRDLSAEELSNIYHLMSHGTKRTVHYAECGDKPIPYQDIMIILKDIIDDPTPEELPHQLIGKPVKIKGA
jgi:hypothetical protein